MPSPFRSHWLANTTVNVYSLTQLPTLSGGKIDTLVPLYTDICSRINMISYDVPFHFEGLELRYVYHLHTWIDPTCTYINIPEGSIIEDVTTLKRYKAIKSKTGNLWKAKPFKLVTEMIVLGDDRFTNFTEKI